jgi:hypothetical protein
MDNKILDITGLGMSHPIQRKDHWIASMKGVMTERSNRLSFFDRLAKPMEIVPVVVILATTIFIYVKGGLESTSGCVICLVVVVAAMPYQRRQIEKRRQAKEILNRYTTSQR